MANLQLVCDGTAGLCASFVVQAQDNNGVAHPATGSATIDQYSLAFVANVSGDNFQIIPKITMTPGQATETVTATFTVTDTASGVALPPLAVSVDLVAPPHPSQLATQLVLTSAPVEATGSSLTDPGSATISVSLT